MRFSLFRQPRNGESSSSSTSPSQPPQAKLSKMSDDTITLMETSASSSSDPPEHGHTNIDSSLAEFLKNMSLTDQKDALQEIQSITQQQSQVVVPPPAIEFHQLSQLQREKALHDIHGVPYDDPDDEYYNVNNLSTGQLQKALLEMNAHLKQQALHADNNPNSATSTSNIGSTEQYQIYDYCAREFPHYIQDWKFQFLFLQSTQKLNPESAAKRLLAFLELKLELFGPQLLGQRITLNHLSKDDLDFMKKGAMQVVPARDRAGRAVIVIFPSLFGKAKTHETALRCFFYTMMLPLKDESTQRSGLAIVIDACADNANTMSRPDPVLFFKCTKLVDALPIKIQGRHFCTNHSLYGFFASYISRFHQKSVRLRSRVHVGSHIECMYSLLTFGIPVDRLPTSTDCTGLKAGRHVKFINALKHLERISPFFQTDYGGGGGSNENHNLNNQSSTSSSSNILIIVPNHSDVLFGRGKPIQMHPGNVWLGTIVEDMVPLYYGESTREGKTAIAQKVVQQVKARGGRFLKHYHEGPSSSSNSNNASGGGIWMEVTDEQGQEKVCTAFRSCRATKKNSHNNNNSNAHLLVANNNIGEKRPRPV